MPYARLVSVLCLVLLPVGSGCSLLTQFDLESQPCDSADACLPGYICGEDKKCHAVGDAGCLSSESACGDGADDDCDGKTDCADSDCEAQTCSDGNACTLGETCNAGTCGGGAPKDCAAPSACKTGGTCNPTTGECEFRDAADGTSCGAMASARCCGGTCVSVTDNASNCGGCGITCGTGRTCQPINLSGCSTAEPANTSGRCGCSATAPCPLGQTCSATGICVPTSATNCAMSQSVTHVGTCPAYCTY